VREPHPPRRPARPHRRVPRPPLLGGIERDDGGRQGVELRVQAAHPGRVAHHVRRLNDATPARYSTVTPSTTQPPPTPAVPGCARPPPSAKAHSARSLIGFWQPRSE